VITSDTDASLKWCSTPPLWHIDAVGGVHPIINELDDQRLANRALPNRSGHGPAARTG
jgi:hypothetical protein